MFKRVLWNCLMSVTETIKTHTKNPKHIHVFDKKKNIHKRKKRQIIKPVSKIKREPTLISTTNH